jgi:hypothetical protein
MKKIKKLKKIDIKYIVAIIISLIIGISILGYGYMDYKYKTNRDKQNSEAVITPTNIPTLEPTDTPTPTPKPTNIPTLKPSPTPTIDPLITAQIKSLEDRMSENNGRINNFNADYNTRYNKLSTLSVEDQNINWLYMNNDKKQIRILDLQNIDLNRQKIDLLLKK